MNSCTEKHIPEYLCLPLDALEHAGFKKVVHQPLGNSETLAGAMRLVVDTGGVVFRCRYPLGAQTNGGPQTFGELLLDLKDLSWDCFVEAVVPQTFKQELVRQRLAAGEYPEPDVLFAPAEEVIDANPDSERA